MVVIQDNLSKKIDNADLKAYYNILCNNENQDYGCQSCDQSKAYRFQDTSDMIFHQFLSRILLYFNKLGICPLRAHMGCELQIQIGNLELFARAIEAAR